MKKCLLYSAIVSIAVALLAFTGCKSDDGKNYEIATIGLPSVFPAEGGEFKAFIKSTGRWQIMEKPNWITSIDPEIAEGDAEIVINVSKNLVSKAPKGAIKIAIGNLNREYKVFQDPFYDITVTEDASNVKEINGNLGGQLKFKVKSNFMWFLSFTSNPSWISASMVKGNLTNIEDKEDEVIITINPNDEKNMRDTEAIFKCDNVTHKFVITQGVPLDIENMTTDAFVGKWRVSENSVSIVDGTVALGKLDAYNVTISKDGSEFVVKGLGYVKSTGKSVDVKGTAEMFGEEPVLYIDRQIFTPADNKDKWVANYDTYFGVDDAGNYKAIAKMNTMGTAITFTTFSSENDITYKIKSYKTADNTITRLGTRRTNTTLYKVYE